MKKKILGVTFVVALVAVAAFNINFNTVKNSNGDLALANVEALAQAEVTGGCYWLITFQGSIYHYTCHDYYSGNYCCFS